MKIFKRTVSLFLAFCLCAGMLLLQPQSTVSAAVRNKPTTTVLRMSSNSFDSSAIYVNLPKAKVCYIKNIKTSSKNLIAKNTHYYTTSSDDTYTDTFASIGLYAKKTGKYKVTYNICDKSGNKLSSGKVTVYVKNDLPVKSVKFAGKEVNYALTSKKSGKLSVKMNKGYTLKKITVDCQHFFRQIFLGYFSDIVQAFDTLRKNVCGDDYTSLHNPIVLSSVLPAYGMFHSIQILFL